MAGGILSSLLSSVLDSLSWTLFLGLSLSDKGFALPAKLNILKRCSYLGRFHESAGYLVEKVSPSPKFQRSGLHLGTFLESFTQFSAQPIIFKDGTTQGLGKCSNQCQGDKQIPQCLATLWMLKVCVWHFYYNPTTPLLLLSQFCSNK